MGWEHVTSERDVYQSLAADSRVQGDNNNRKQGQIEIYSQFSDTYLQKVPRIHGEQEMELWCEAKNPVGSRVKKELSSSYF